MRINTNKRKEGIYEYLIEKKKLYIVIDKKKKGRGKIANYQNIVNFEID